MEDIFGPGSSNVFTKSFVDLLGWICTFSIQVHSFFIPVRLSRVCSYVPVCVSFLPQMCRLELLRGIMFFSLPLWYWTVKHLQPCLSCEHNFPICLLFLFAAGAAQAPAPIFFWNSVPLLVNLCSFRQRWKLLPRMNQAEVSDITSEVLFVFSMMIKCIKVHLQITQKAERLSKKACLKVNMIRCGCFSAQQWPKAYSLDNSGCSQSPDNKSK